MNILDDDEWDLPISNKKKKYDLKDDIDDIDNIDDIDDIDDINDIVINDDLIEDDLIEDNLIEDNLIEDNLLKQIINNSDQNNNMYWIIPLHIIFKFNEKEFEDKTFGILIKQNIYNVDIDKILSSNDYDEYDIISENIIKNITNIFYFLKNRYFIGTINIIKAVSIADINMELIEQYSNNSLIRINDNFEINEELMKNKPLNIININVFDNICLSSDVIDNIKNDILVNPNNASLYIINSISSYIMMHYLQHYNILNNKSNNDFLKKILISFGKTTLQLLLSIDKLHTFNNNSHVQFKKFLNDQLLKVNNNTKLELTKNMLTYGFHFQEAWYTAFKSNPSISLKHILFGGCFINSQYKMHSLSYTVLFEVNNYIYVNYNDYGWFRYHYKYVNKEHKIFEEQLDLNHVYFESPLLEYGNWNIKKEIKNNTILRSSILNNNNLPSKINKFLKGHPLITHIQNINKGNSLGGGEYINVSPYSIRELKSPQELQIRYIFNNTEDWRVYRRGQNFNLYEWSVDSEHIIYSNDPLTQFKKIYNFFETNDDWINFRKKNINSIDYLTFKHILLNHFDNENIIKEIWFRLIGPDGGDILYKYSLKGRWIELRYCEKYKMLSSGRCINNQFLLIPIKIKKWLFNNTLTLLCLPNPINVKEIYNKLIDLPLIKVSINNNNNYYETSEGNELSYINSNNYKIWVYIDCDPIRNDKQFIEKNIIIYDNNINNNILKINYIDSNIDIINKLRKYYIKFPFINNIMFHIIETNTKDKLFINLSEIYLINNIKFNNYNFIIEALTHSSFQLQMQTYHNMAIIGRNLINYIILEIILGKNNIYTSDLIIFEKEDNLNNFISNDIKLDLQELTTDLNLAYACINTSLYKHILHNNKKLERLISSDNPKNYIDDDELKQILADVFAAYITASLFSDTRLNTFYKIKVFIINTLITKTFIIQKNQVNKKTKLCRICNQMFNSEQQYKNHSIGKKHLNKLSNLNLENNFNIDYDYDNDSDNESISDSIIEKNKKIFNKASSTECNKASSSTIPNGNSRTSCTIPNGNSRTSCTIPNRNSRTSCTIPNGNSRTSCTSSTECNIQDNSKHIEATKVLSSGGLWVEKDKINKYYESIKLDDKSSKLNYDYNQYYLNQYYLYLYHFNLTNNNEFIHPLTFELFVDYINYNGSYV